MTMLAALAGAYDRLAAQGVVPSYGYTTEKIGFLVTLSADGNPVGEPVDLREGNGRSLQPRAMPVPAAFKRPGTALRPFFLWDNSAYALGVTAADRKDGAARFDAFRSYHRRVLDGTDDPGLLALRRFVEGWTPEDFQRLGWPDAMKDQNLVFALDADRRSEIRIHDRPAARALWAQLCADAARPAAACLVSGVQAPVARLHPAIKGVWGAQSAGASLVSFNLAASESYGHKQGDNAPVSDLSAFAYTTVLNHLLARDSKQRIQIGDASTVFWADASNAADVAAAESAFGMLIGGTEIDETIENAKVRAVLDAVRTGRPLAEVAPDLADGVRFCVLGLAPNAARLSVRYWQEDEFGAFGDRLARHFAAMRIEPPPPEAAPSIWRCLIETAAQRKTENIPPNLAGAWLRAILTGTAYPATLIATLLMRMRADKDVNALRIAMLKATFVSQGKEIPVSLDPRNTDPGYLLGRLFAAFEYAQTQALGPTIKATIRDKYYGTASATPRAVFPILQRTATHHLSRLRKDRPGRARWLDERIAEIFDLADADTLFVPTLTAHRQALFAVGYYHQKHEFFRRRDAAETTNGTEEEAAS